MGGCIKIIIVLPFESLSCTSNISWSIKIMIVIHLNALGIQVRIVPTYLFYTFWVVRNLFSTYKKIPTLADIMLNIILETNLNNYLLSSCRTLLTTAAPPLMPCLPVAMYSAAQRNIVLLHYSKVPPSMLFPPALLPIIVLPSWITVTC